MDSKLDLVFGADSKKRSAAAARICWIEGPRFAQESIRAAREGTTSSITRMHTEQSPGIHLSGSGMAKPLVSIAILSVESDSTLAKDLEKRMEPNFKANNERSLATTASHV